MSKIIQNPIAASSVPQTVQVEAIVIRFSPGRGLLADKFPRQTGFSPEMLRMFREESNHHIEVQGPDAIGTRININLANGLATYELTDRAMAPGVGNFFLAKRVNFKLLLAGKECECDTYGLRELGKLADTWPVIAAFKKDLLDDESPALKDIMRLRNANRNPQVRFILNGCRALYSVMMPFEKNDGTVVHIAERLKLQTADGVVVRLPTVHMGGNSLMINHGLKLF